MQVHLVVVKQFAALARGDIVTDPVRIAEILKSEHAPLVVRVAPPPTREPEFDAYRAAGQHKHDCSCGT